MSRYALLNPPKREQDDIIAGTIWRLVLEINARKSPPDLLKRFLQHEKYRHLGITQLQSESEKDR